MIKLIAFLSIFLFAQPSFTESKLADSSSLKNKKISIKSDQQMKLLFDKEKKATFKGNVTIKMEHMTMKCQILHVEYEEIKEKLTLKSLQGEGEVYAEEKEKKIQAWCDRLTYTHRDEIMKVFSNTTSKVIKEGQSFQAKSFVIDLKTSEMDVIGQNILEIQLD